jgi:hypothetical protein
MEFGQLVYIRVGTAIAKAKYCGYYYQGCHERGKYVVFCEIFGGIQMVEEVFSDLKSAWQPFGIDA